MPKKYIVGIDFGQLNSAAWVVPLNDIDWMSTSGEALKFSSAGAINERVIDSVVYKSENGDYSLRPHLRTNIIRKMKSRVSDLRKKP